MGDFFIFGKTPNMNKAIKIANPCKESWDNMQEEPQGRFCSVCSKKVFDLDLLSINTIRKILNNNSEVCGKLSTSGSMVPKLFLAITLTATSYSSAQIEKNNITEDPFQKNITINGKLLIAENKKLISGMFSLLTLQKHYSVEVNKDGTFALTFPEKIIKENNIIRIDYKISDGKKDYDDHKSLMLKSNELLTKHNFDLEEKYSTIGAVVILSPEPPDFYYLDGKRIGKRKFQKIKNAFPAYQYFTIYDETIVKEMIKEEYVGNLYLLYSN